MRFLGRSLIGMFLLSLTLGLLAWAGFTVFTAVEERRAAEQRVRPARERVFAVNVMTANPQSITPELQVFGEVIAARVLELRAPVSGRVVEMADGFEEGRTVTEGQLLLRIDPAEAEAALASARNDLIEAEADVRDANRLAALAEEERLAAQAQADLRQRALARQQDLLERGVGSASAVEAAELALSSATQAVLTRKQAIASAQARLDQTAAAVERRRIALAEAERELAQTTVYAGFTGTLAETSVTLGGLVTANEQLARIIDPDELEVALRLSTAQHARLLDEAGRLRDAPVTLGLDVLGLDITTTGRLTREAAAVGDGQTGRLVFASLDASQGFRPGDFVEVRVEEPPLPFAVRLPSTALSAQGQVLVLGDEDRLEELPVTLLRRQGDDVLVRARDLAGRDVVNERTPLLGAGIKVRPLRPEAPAAAAPSMIELDAERRARLVAFVEGNARIPADVKERMLGRLAEDKVPANMVERLESRMGS